MKDGGAHSENAYFAEGPYGASGENYSEAGSVVTNIEVVDIDGVTKTVTDDLHRPWSSPAAAARP